MTVLLRLRGVRACLGGRSDRPALWDIDLTIHGGERVALLGANGSGKSTLLRVLMGLQRCEGEIWRASGQRAALVFQRPYLLRLSVLHNVALAAWLQGQRWATACARAREALALVGLADCAAHPAPSLSGGQQQRLAVARAWVQQPSLWLLDEPTASLDPGARQEIESLMLRCAHEAGKAGALVFSSHHLGQVRRLATRVVYLEQGRIQADLPVEQFFDAQTLARCAPRAHDFVVQEWV
jgi:tungstate transport system ATP-binding protein